MLHCLLLNRRKHLKESKTYSGHSFRCISALHRQEESRVVGAQSVAVGAYPGGYSHSNRQEAEREQAGNTNGYFVRSRTHTSDQLPPARTHFLKALQPSNSAICTTFYNVGRCYAGH